MVALLCCLICLPSWAGQDDLSREVVLEPDANETDGIESKFDSLQKDLQESPDNRQIEAQLEKIKQVLYKRHYKAGKELQKQGYLLSAVGAYQKALLYRSQDTRAAKALAEAKEKLAEVDLREAERAYEDGVRALQRGDKEGAAGAWKKALGLNPLHGEAQDALEKLNPPENTSEPGTPKSPILEKMPSAQEPTQGVVQNPELLDSLWEQNYRSGAERMRLGQYEEAAKYFQRALKYSPDDEATRQQLAKARGMLKDKGAQKSMDFYWLAVRALRELNYRRAYRYLDDSVRADPDNQEARKLLSDLVQKRPEVTKPLKRPDVGLDTIIKEDQGIQR